MIDKVRIKDGELEQRMDEIDHYLGRNDYRKRLHKIKGISRCNRRWDEREWEKDHFKDQSLTTILDVTKGMV